MSAATTTLTGGRAKLAAGLEILLGCCVAATVVLSLTAGPRQDANPPGAFYRQPLVGLLALGDGRLVPHAAVLGAVALILVLAAALRARPDARGGTAAFGVLLLLGPVLNYDGLIAALSLSPEDAAILGQTAVDTFTPWLPVSWPLLGAAGLLIPWFIAVGRGGVPPAATAFGLVSVALPLLAVGLNLALIAARGNAGLLHLLQWPQGAAAASVIAHAGAALTATAACGRTELGSRVTAGATALALVAAVAMGAGR